MVNVLRRWTSLFIENNNEKRHKTQNTKTKTKNIHRDYEDDEKENKNNNNTQKKNRNETERNATQFKQKYSQSAILTIKHIDHHIILRILWSHFCMGVYLSVLFCRFFFSSYVCVYNVYSYIQCIFACACVCVCVKFQKNFIEHRKLSTSAAQ